MPVDGRDFLKSMFKQRVGNQYFAPGMVGLDSEEVEGAVGAGRKSVGSANISHA